MISDHDTTIGQGLLIPHILYIMCILSLYLQFRVTLQNDQVTNGGSHQTNV